MIDPKFKGPNELVASVITEELSRLGIGSFWLSPGLRSAPLVHAVNKNQKNRIIWHNDERGAAFAALGYAKASKKPAILICTSGTAVANFAPAVLEAKASQTPMIILSADLPRQKINRGENQTLEQLQIFQNYLLWQHDIEASSINLDLSEVLSAIDFAVSKSKFPGGPVQINLRFSKPLDSGLEKEYLDLWLKNWTSNLSNWFSSDKPYLTYNLESSALIKDDLLSLIKASSKPLFIAGTLKEQEGKRELLSLASEMGAPVIADITSGLRWENSEGAFVSAHYDLFLDSFTENPDCILHFGDGIISKNLQNYISKQNCPYILITESEDRFDPLGKVSYHLKSSILEATKALSKKLNEGTNTDFLKAFQLEELRIKEFLNTTSEFSEWSLVREVFKTLPSKWGIFLANSLPIREADNFVTQHQIDLEISANRGVSGIDGTISSAIGFSEGCGKPVLLLSGDLSFLHDLNALSVIRHLKHPLIVVLFNNQGGAIFQLEHIRPYTSDNENFFVTPHELRFASAAKMFNLDYYQPDNFDNFQKDLTTAFQNLRSAIIEVNFESEAVVEDLKRVREEVNNDKY